VLSFIYMLAEAVGGWWTNSLALLADSGHMLTDVVAMSLTLVAAWLAERPPTDRKTYGYYRLEILAAFANGIVLVLLSVWIIIEAVGRWRQPANVAGSEMTLIAAGGLAINVVSAMLLGGHHGSDLNLRGAWLHVMGDLLGSVAAIAAGVLILTMGWLWADAAGSMIISVIIIAGSIRLILESVDVLLEGTPRHIDLRSVESVILETDGVSGVHDLHVWTISSGMEALSAHISHENLIKHAELLADVRRRIHEVFGIDHLTIQMESLDHESEALYVCSGDTRCFEPTKETRRPKSIERTQHYE
jgi:cobalt-zinc-cadmium efflux system protein